MSHEGPQTPEDIQVEWQKAEAVLTTETANHDSLDADITRLAALSKREYERCRRDEAKRLGVRASALDKEVAAARGGQDADSEAKNLGLFNPEPSDEPVDGDDLLDRIVGAINRYVVMPQHATEAVALWVVHTHSFSLWQHTPRLHVKSPVMGSGKSTLLDVIACMVPRALKTENLSVAVMFRAIEKYKPTLLVDEVDTFLRDNEDLRGCLNAGHAKGSKHLRCEGDNHELKAFETFAPAALAGIGEFRGKLATLADRSIPITLQRRKPDEHVRDYRADRAAELCELASDIARWVADNQKALKEAEPRMPAGIHNRRADNCRPLLAIADVAGGEWPERARTAALALTGTGDTEADTFKVQLLADIRNIFDEGGVERIETKSLINALVDMDERPWGGYRHGKQITPRQFSSLIKSFGIQSATIRFDDSKVAKGYRRADFEEAFARYLPDQVSGVTEENGARAPDTGMLSVTTLQPAGNREISADSIRYKEANVTDTKEVLPQENQQFNGCNGKNTGNRGSAPISEVDGDIEERRAIQEIDGGMTPAEAEQQQEMPPIPDFLRR